MLRSMSVDAGAKQPLLHTEFPWPIRPRGGGRPQAIATHTGNTGPAATNQARQKACGWACTQGAGVSSDHNKPRHPQ